MQSPEVTLAASPSHRNACGGDRDHPHILLALDQLSATLGGGERVVLRLARLLPAWGYRVSILTLSLSPQCPAMADPPCPIYLLPLQRTWDWNALRAARALRLFLAAQQVSLVQTFFESADLWVGSVAKTVPGVRLVWSRRDMGILRDRKHEIAYRLLRRMPDRVLAVSEQVRRHCIEVDGVHPEKVETLHNGIDIPESRMPEAVALPTNQKRWTVVSVGNVRPVKGFDVLLQAAILVMRHFPQVEFQIAGEILDREHHAEIMRRAHEAGVDDRFLFLGNVKDVRPLLHSSGIFVLPSRSEGFSNAIVEAMAASLPVVATRVGGNDEAVVDEITGFVVPPEDPDALASALQRLLADQALALQMGNAGHGRAVQHFTTESMLSRLSGVYKTLLKPS